MFPKGLWTRRNQWNKYVFHITCSYICIYLITEIVDERNVIMFFLSLFFFLTLKRHRSQRASPVYLRSGRVYFMEALMIDAGGPDHLSVGVRIPRGGLQRPISNRYLYVIPPGKVLFLLSFSSMLVLIL
jgi:hypothetical protein